MPRIRTIKPSFWDSPATAATSLRGRLLFIAMWTWADDYGIGDASPKRLLAYAFPNDEIEVSEIPSLCGEISERYGVVFYTHDDRPYFFIPSFDKHQRTEKRAAQHVPFPDQLENTAIPGAEKKVSENPSPSDGNVAAGSRKGEVGSRKDKHTPPNRSPSAAPAVAVERASESLDHFDAFWTAYPRKSGKGAARAAFARATKKLDVESIIAAARRHAEYHCAERSAERFIPHPATWLNQERWDDELRPGQGKPQRQAETDSLFDAAMQRAIERDRQATA